VAGVVAEERGERVRGAAVGEGAARLQVRHHHRALRVQDLGGLGHEVDAAEDDDVAVHLLRRLGELQRVADHVGQVLDLGFLVIMGQDDRIPLLLQAEDLVLVVDAELRRGAHGGPQGARAVEERG
jgi:hypothetical protein